MEGTIMSSFFLIDFESWIGCTKKVSDCQGCTLAELAEETSPIFTALLHAATLKHVKVRILVSSRQLPPTCDKSATPLDWLMQNKIDIRHATNQFSTHLILIDGAIRLLLTSMSTNVASFLYNRESSITVEAGKCEQLKTFLIKQFEKAWLSGIPHIIQVPYTAADKDTMTNHVKRSIFSVEQPDSTLSGLGASITEMVTFRDVEVSKVFFGPLAFRSSLLKVLREVKESLVVAIPGISDTEICEVHLKLSSKIKVMISYTHSTKAEADLIHVSLRNCMLPPSRCIIIFSINIVYYY